MRPISSLRVNLTGDAIAIFELAALDIDISTVDNLNKVIMKMTNHRIFKICFSQTKVVLTQVPNQIQDHSLVGEFSPDTPGQVNVLYLTDEIMDFIYQSMLTMWKNKMIEQVFNYKGSTEKEITNFFETRVENLECKEGKKKYFALYMSKAKQ